MDWQTEDNVPNVSRTSTERIPSLLLPSYENIMESADRIFSSDNMLIAHSPNLMLYLT